MGLRDLVRWLVLLEGTLGMVSPLAAQPAPTTPQQLPAPAPTGPDRTAANSAASTPQFAPLTGDAKASFDAGYECYTKEQYTCARDHFQRVYEQSRDPDWRTRMLYRMAECEDLLEHYSAALKLARRYLQASPKGRDADEVRQLIQHAVGKVGGLWVKTTEAGAQVRVDDELVATTPMQQSVPVDPGPHRVTANKPGFRTAQQLVRVKGAGQVETVPLILEPQRGRLSIVVGPQESTIHLDGKSLGQGAWQGEVSVGAHTVVAKAPDRKSHQENLTLDQDGDRIKLDWRLEPVSPSPGKCLGVPAVWCFVGAGVVLVTGAVVAGYYLGRPDTMREAPAGTLGTASLGLSLGGRP
jgi:hypothetical protein